MHVLVLDDTNPRSLAGVLRRLRTELGKLPARPEGPQALNDLLPAQGVGFDLESLRDLDPLALAARVRNTADSLRGTAFAMADAVGLRHFALAEA
jgi:uncharacterized alpha-E superfamily protein